MKKLLLAVLAVIMMVGCNEKDADVFRIDLIFPLTGNGASASEATINAIKMCANKWNNNGGINGLKIVIKQHDSKGQAKDAILVAKDVAINNSNVVISAMSPVSLSILPILEKNEILHLAFSGANELFENDPKYVVRGSISSNQIGNSFVRLYQEKFIDKNLYIFYCNDEFGRSYRDATVTAARDIKLSEIKTIPYENNMTSYRDVILKSQITNNDLAFVIGLQGSLGKFLKQFRESGFSGTIICEPNITSASTLAMLSSEHLNNVYYLSVKEDDSLLAPVIKEYNELYDSVPSELALDAYNNVDIILNIFDKIGENNSSKFIDYDSSYKINGLFGPTSIINQEVQYNLLLKEGENLL